jgi:hypothetical protein
MNLPAANRGVSLKVKFILSQPRLAGFPLRYNKRRGGRPYRFRIALKEIRVIRVICEICGLNSDRIQPFDLPFNCIYKTAGSN